VLEGSVTSSSLIYTPFVGVCTASTPFVLLGDVLDCLPLDQCDTIFTFVEKNVATWKSVSALVSFPDNPSTIEIEFRRKLCL
jgi:hypothetical protein